MKPALAVVLLAAWPVAAGWAQAVPGLGAEGVVGSAGIEAVAAENLLGLPANPAAVAASTRWSADVGASSAAITDIVERSFAASTRIGRLGVGGRITSRWVKDLFDDPALQSSAGLSVETAVYAVGVSLPVFEGVRVGYMSFLTTANVLGSSATGTGHRMGAVATSRWLRAGVTYGYSDAPLDWTSPGGTTLHTDGTKRLSIGAATPRIRALPVEPEVAVEWSRDSGSDRDSWVRGSLSLAALHGRLQALGGWAICTTQRASSYREIGVIAYIIQFQLQFGMRFGADPVPGNSFTLGVGLYGR